MEKEKFYINGVEVTEEEYKEYHNDDYERFVKEPSLKSLF